MGSFLVLLAQADVYLLRTTLYIRHRARVPSPAAQPTPHTLPSPADSTHLTWCVPGGASL